MQIEPEISGCTVVLLGKFNPAIFQPAWLIAHGVEDGSSDAEIGVLHRDVAQFTIDSRNYFVDHDRFQVSTASAPWIILSDVVSSIFLELLPHTPIRAFGINRDVHFRLPSMEHRHRLGRRLAPIAPWGAFGEQLENEDPNLVGGLQSLTMRKQFSVQGANVHINATVEPSAKLTTSSGVYMQINNHHLMTDLPDGHGSKEAVSMMRDSFESIIEGSEKIIDTIMKAGQKYE